VSTVCESSLDDATRLLIAPLLAVLVGVEGELAKVEHTLSKMAMREPITKLLATAPGVGLIVASTFVSVIDEAKRFRNAQAVGAYLASRSHERDSTAMTPAHTHPERFDAAGLSSRRRCTLTQGVHERSARARKRFVRVLVA